MIAGCPASCAAAEPASINHNPLRLGLFEAFIHFRFGDP